MRYWEIPPGTFHLGAVPGDADADDDEKPRHRVKISRPFHQSVTPVTVGAFRQFTEDPDIDIEMPPPPNFNPGWKRQNHPIVRVAWDQAQRHCAWAGGRLPTERLRPRPHGRERVGVDGRLVRPG
jgi:formylglycine-generating enzyme required for sulfatase activity